jgi:tRNA-2-methylthio-N6-dimethylallyladenosine synthase
MQDDISMETKKERFNRLVEKINKYALQRNKEYVGKTLKVLVEGESKRNKDILSGYSENFKLVNFKGDKNMIGKVVSVKINVAKTFTLEGEQVDE